MTNFCQACGGQRGLHFSTLPGCTCVNPTPINYVINQQIKREWVGLTDDELTQLYCAVDGKEWCLGGLSNAHTFYEAIEAKLKEKNA